MSDDFERLHGDPLWVAGKRFDNDLKKVLDRYPEGAPDRVVAAVLLVDEAEVPSLFKRIMAKVRNFARRRAL